MSKVRMVVLACWTLAVLTATQNFAQRPREELPKTAMNFLLQKLDESRPGARSLRRNNKFLGTLKGQKGVQVAFVIDGTESMGAELEALKKHISGIAENLNDQVEDRDFRAEIAIVVYRDSKAPSGRVKLVVPEFTTDIFEITKKLDEVRIETGAPYFDEAVDEGVHAALTKLNWNVRDDISRWIVLCGDAPPYPESTKHRRFSLSELIEAARNKQVTVYGLCVNSSIDPQKEPAMATASIALRPECSMFFARLAEGTGGQVRNLWDQESLLAELKQKPLAVPMPTITEEDIAAVRRKLDVSPVIAVLPPAGSEGTLFAKGSEGTIFAMAAQRYLTNLGYAVRSPGSLEAEYQDAAASGASERETIAKLANQVSADFVLSGAVTTDTEQGETQLTFKLYGRKSNKELGTESTRWATKSSVSVSDKAAMVISDLLEKASRTDPRVRPAQPIAEGKAKVDFLARDMRASRSILSGMYSLEKSLSTGGMVLDSSYDKRSNALSLLRSALTDFKAAAEYEADNPVNELLLAQTCYNLVAIGEMTDESHRHFLHLQRAYELRLQPGFEATSWPAEIEGYHALLVEKDINRAVKVFEEIALKPGRETSMAALRAHWMLAGLYVGDWESRVFAPEIVDPVKSREHVLAILALWPQLAEADFYRQCLRQSRSGSGEMFVPLTASISATGSSQLSK
jgi:hypothetical protein